MGLEYLNEETGADVTVCGAISRVELGDFNIIKDPLEERKDEKEFLKLPFVLLPQCCTDFNNIQWLPQVDSLKLQVNMDIRGPTSGVSAVLTRVVCCAGSRWTRSSRCPPLCWPAAGASRASGTGSSSRPSSSTGTRTAWAATCVAVDSGRWAADSTTSWGGNYVGETTSGWFIMCDIMTWSISLWFGSSNQYLSSNDQAGSAQRTRCQSLNLTRQMPLCHFH